jgi:hypothetical protein
MLGAFAAAAACVVGEIDYTGKTCPCPDGWLCVDGVCGHHDALPEAGADASLGQVDAGAFCARLSPAPVYCNDFDEDGGLGGLGDLFPQTSSGGVVGVSGAEARSLPNSFFARVPALSSGQSAYAVAVGNETVSSSTPSQVSLAFSANVHITTGSQLGHLATLIFASGYGVGVVAEPGSVFVDELTPGDAGSGTIEHPHTEKDWSGGWVRVTLSVRRVGSGWTSSLSLDDAVVEDGRSLSAPFTAGTLATFVLGWGFVAGPSNELAASIDDVVLNASE